MNETEKLELESLTGLEPDEDEIEDGIPMWLLMLPTGLLIALAWLFVRGE